MKGQNQTIISVSMSVSKISDVTAFEEMPLKEAKLRRRKKQNFLQDYNKKKKTAELHLSTSFIRPQSRHTSSIEYKKNK